MNSLLLICLVRYLADVPEVHRHADFPPVSVVLHCPELVDVLLGQVVLPRPPQYHVLVHPAGPLVLLLGLDQEVGDGLLQTTIVKLMKRAPQNDE